MQKNVVFARKLSLSQQNCLIKPLFVNNQEVKIDTLQKHLQSTFSFSDDLVLRPIAICDKQCLLAYVDGGTDKQLLEQDVIRPLKEATSFEKPYADSLPQIVDYSEAIKTTPLRDAPGTIAEGDVVLFLEEETECFVFSLRKFEHRAIVEPPTQSVMKGPREGFIEAIKPNLALIRQRIKSPDLVVKTFSVGRYSTTSVALLYINGIAQKHIVDDLCRRIEKIDIDGVIDSAYILAFIQTRKSSIFLQAGTTEKPDVASAKLLEGRIAILVDGSPIVLTLPYLIFEDVQDGYDYYSGDWRATMVRFFRLIGAMLSLLLPGAYISLQTYHFQLLPLKFLMTLMSATTSIPFPPAIEMLVVLLLFEILNQASIRMPRYFGISLSVVGAIVLGDTAVKAGIISSPSVLVIALSAVGIFCIPDQVGTMSILRILYLLVSAVIGFVGMIVFTIILIGYLSTLDNFGTPYLAPYAPRIIPDLKDGIFKSGFSAMELRPYSIPTENRTRINKQGKNL